MRTLHGATITLTDQICLSPLCISSLIRPTFHLPLGRLSLMSTMSPTSGTVAAVLRGPFKSSCVCSRKLNRYSFLYIVQNWFKCLCPCFHVCSNCSAEPFFAISYSGSLSSVRSGITCLECREMHRGENHTRIDVIINVNQWASVDYCLNFS